MNGGHHVAQVRTDSVVCAPALPDLHHHLPGEEGNNATRRRSPSSTRSNIARRSTHDRVVAHGPAHRSRRACLTCTSASAGPPSSSTRRGRQREATLISSIRSTSRRSWHVGVVAHGPAHCVRCYAPWSYALSTTAQTAVLASSARWLRASGLHQLAPFEPATWLGLDQAP